MLFQKNSTVEFFWNEKIDDFQEVRYNIFEEMCLMKGIEFNMEIKRDYYLNKLIEARNDGLIKVVTGIRRCGKSYLLNRLFYNHLIESGVAEDHIVRIASYV